MKKIFFISLVFLATILVTKAQTEAELIGLLDELQPTYEVLQDEYEANLLNTVVISLDKANNRVNFESPHSIKGINITIKDKYERILVQQNNMTISKHYSITFPPKAGINRYTVILQKDNQVVVQRVEKDWI